MTRDETADSEDTVPAMDAEWSVVEQRHYEPEGTEELTTVIIRAVAAAEDATLPEVTDPPLYDVVDVPGVENALFGPRRAGSGTGDGSLTFEYRGFRVTVRNDGWVQVAEPAGP